MPNANMLREREEGKAPKVIPRTPITDAYYKFTNDASLRKAKKQGAFPNARIPCEHSSTLRFAAALLIEAADQMDAGKVSEFIVHQQTAKGVLSAVPGVFGEGARYIKP